MMQVIPKWQIDVVLSDGTRQSIWISDNYAENVLRQVAAISFAKSGLTRIAEIKIWQPSQQEQIGTAVFYREEPPNQ